jgi:hypothetical protein
VKTPGSEVTLKNTLSKKLTCLAVLLMSTISFAGVREDISGYVGGLSNQTYKDVGNVPGNRYNGSLRFDYNHPHETTSLRDLERRFTFETMVNDQNLTTNSVQEAYVGVNITSKDHVRAGRHVLPWSEIDRVWGFGQLNNRKNFSGFEPDQEGLVGLIYERKSSNGMRYRAFGSGIYVPELNPPLDIDKKNKTITSRHPWADAPAKTVEVEPGNVKTIAYDVDYPEPQDVIYRYSLGASLGFESKHWVWDNFVMRKPENLMTTKVTVSLDPDADVVEAFIKPQFFYHDVFGSSLKYRNRDMEMYVSGMGVRPNTYPDGDIDATRATDIKTEKIREDYIGGGISRSNDLYSMGLGYVARLSPYTRNSDSLALDPRWNQAVNLFISRTFWQRVVISSDLKYDTLTTDRLTMLRVIYKATKELQMSVGVNMIGTPADGRSYWSPYTNNDSAYGALRYVF